MVKGHTGKSPQCSMPLSTGQGLFSTLDFEYFFILDDRIDVFYSELQGKKRYQGSIPEASANNIMPLKSILMLLII